MEKPAKTMRVVIGIWLAFLYAICISGVVVSLTLFQLQHKILATPERPPQPADTMVFHQCSLDGLEVADIGKGGTHSLACVPVKTSLNQGFQSPAKVLEILEKQEKSVNDLKRESREKQEKLESLRSSVLYNEIDSDLRDSFLGIFDKQKQHDSLLVEREKLRMELKQAIDPKSQEDIKLSFDEKQTKIDQIMVEITIGNKLIDGQIASLASEPRVTNLLNLKGVENTSELGMEAGLAANGSAAIGDFPVQARMGAPVEPSLEAASNAGQMVDLRGILEGYLKTEMALKREIRKIDNEIVFFMDQSAHLVDIKTDIAFYKKFFPGMESLGLEDDAPFWAAPFNLLTLILILSMGALGSLIFLTNDYLERAKAEDKFSMYIFRPLLGMALAFSIFVMFKSGQSLLGIDPGQRQSPFFVAFIGLISGMLAEKAYRRITTQGEKLFAIEEPAPVTPGTGSKS